MERVCSSLEALVEHLDCEALEVALVVGNLRDDVDAAHPLSNTSMLLELGGKEVLGKAAALPKGSQRYAAAPVQPSIYWGRARYRRSDGFRCGHGHTQM